jgi:alkaline phosphatase D
LSDGTFQHGVASGDPLSDAVVIWTRVTTAQEAEPVAWKLAADEGLTELVASGDAVAHADADHTVNVDVSGLDPATTYYYGFEAAGEGSPVARTRTLPGEGAERLRFAMCSCAKYNAGYFNAYARIAEKGAAGELDFLLHMGDYIYEASQNPPPPQTPSPSMGRDFEPPEECRSLADYRTRYAQYHRDPDVQAMHHAMPMIATLDDHELADGAWAGGADNHKPEDGPWERRRDDAMRARWEWLPARQPDPGDPTRVFRTVSAGGLADLFLCDIRSRRDQPALEPRMSDPERSMLGRPQREWLFDALEESTARWRLLVSPSILNTTWIENPSELMKTAALKLKLMDEDGEGPDEDQWDGYPAERAKLLTLLRKFDNAVTLSGDIHVSAAATIDDDDGPIVTEFTTTSLTSQNLDEKLGVDQRAAEVVACEEEFLAGMDHFKWVEMSSHGYVVVDVDPRRVRAEWHLVDSVAERVPGERMAAAFEVPLGERVPVRA